MGHGTVDAANLTVRPPLDPVSPAEPLQRRDRNVHCLDPNAQRGNATLLTQFACPWVYSKNATRISIAFDIIRDLRFLSANLTHTSLISQPSSLCTS